MATHDYVIANGTGAAVRSDLNNALAAIVSNNSSSTEPGTTYAYQWWADTNADLLKLRNSSNDGWITLSALDGTILIPDGNASSPGISFRDDTNTGMFSGAADQIGFATGGAERLEIGSSEVVFNDPSNDVDFRVESNGNTHMLFVDAGNDRVGIGASSPQNMLHLNGSDPAIRLSDTGANGSAFSIIEDNNGLLKFRNDASNAGTGSGIAFEVDASERARIDASGRLLVGTSSSSASTAAVFQGNSFSSGQANQVYFQRDTAGTGLSAGDGIGFLLFADNAGNVFSQIGCQADATTGSSDYPGRLAFYTTADGASSPTERLRIDSSGNVGISTTTTSGANLVIATNSNGGSGIKLIGKSANGGAEIDFRNNADSTLNGFIEFNDNGGILSTVVNQPQVFRTNNTERMRIDSSGRLLVGTTSNIAPDGFASRIQTAGTNHEGGSLTIRRDQNSGSGAALLLTKSRSTSAGGNTVVQDGDNIGSIRFYAADGTDANSYCANIAASIDGTPGGNDVPGRLEFYTTANGASSATEHMRIANSGLSDIYASSSTLRLRTGTSGSSGQLLGGFHSATNISNGTQSLAIFANGNIQNTNNSYGSLSDAKLKENVVDANSQWDDIKGIRVRNYNFIEGETHTQLGVVAQEVETVSPGLVTDSPDLDEEGNDLGTVTKSVNYSVLYMKAVKALQEAMDRIETLETKVAALEAG